MQVEIERKYLLTQLPTMPRVREVVEIAQGYIPGKNLVERLRRETRKGGSMRYYRTVKAGRGVERIELEDETDERTFEHLWQLTDGRRLTKRRYRVPEGEDEWEIDEFTDRELVLAELEMPTTDYRIVIPEWLVPVLVRDVTEEPGYTNRALAR